MRSAAVWVVVAGCGASAGTRAPEEARKKPTTTTTTTTSSISTERAPADPAKRAAGGVSSRVAGRAGAETEIAFCVEETNRLRVGLGRPALGRSYVLDSYAARGAEMDARARRPHEHYNTVPFPETFSQLAENELPWWHLDGDGGAVRRFLRTGIASMFAEGPGGGHYENLVGPFTEMGCGLWIDGDEITLVQDFRTP